MASATSSTACSRTCWRCFFSLLFRLAAAILEIGSIPAAASQLKTWRRELFGKCSLAAFWAICQVRLADFTHDFLAEATACALIIIDRHVESSAHQKYEIIPEMQMAIKDEISIL